jgi:hypothetical protein
MIALMTLDVFIPVLEARDGQNDEQRYGRQTRRHVGEAREKLENDEDCRRPS